MNKTDYNIIGADGSVKNWFRQPFGVYDSAGVLRQVQEGHSAYDASGVRLPIMKFDSIPFGAWLDTDGVTIKMKYGVAASNLTGNITVVYMGSSTMAGYGLTAPNRLEDQLKTKLNGVATSNTVYNLAVGGYTMANLRTVANGGTSGKNIEAAMAYHPDFIYVDEPTNWATSYDATTQISYMMEIFNYAFQRGAIVLFGGARPRTPYTGTSLTRITTFNSIVAQHRTLKFVTLDAFTPFLQDGTTGSLKTEYDQGDGIHMNAAGNAVLANYVFAWWQKCITDPTAFTQYTIQQSTDGTNYTNLMTRTPTQNTYSVTATGNQYFRIVGTLKAGGTNDASAASYVTYTPPAVITAQFDFGKDTGTPVHTPVSGWVEVLADVYANGDKTSAVYPGTSIYVFLRSKNAVGTSIWGNNGGTSANNIGKQPIPSGSGVFPDTVITSGMYTTGINYVEGNEQVYIRGLTPGARYTVSAFGSRTSVSDGRTTDYHLKDANGVTAILGYPVQDNISTLATFTGQVADSLGNLYLSFNKPTASSINFAYLMALTVKPE